MRTAVLVAAVCVGLAGCASQRPVAVVSVPTTPAMVPPPSLPASGPAPMADGVPSAGGQGLARTLPAQPPRQLADGSKVPAVQGLLQTAERERRAGRLDAAASALERAQRLAPQSAIVYQRLAEVRLQQKRPAEAEHLARKGVGFAAGAGAQASLWRLIADACRQQGRLQAAEEAAVRAATLEARARELL